MNSFIVTNAAAGHGSGKWLSPFEGAGAAALLKFKLLCNGKGKQVCTLFTPSRLAKKGNQGFVFPGSSTYSRMSPGWQLSALQMASRVLKRIALALPVFKMERLDNVKSTLSESSLREILRFAIITSKFTMIGIGYTVKSFSF
jgi:hypothetical protein